MLLNVHSGGSDAYHYMSRVLETFSHIRSGLDVASELTESSQGATQ